MVWEMPLPLVWLWIGLEEIYYTVCVRLHVNVDGIQLKYIDDESLLFCWCFLCIVMFDGATQMYLCNWVCFALGNFNELKYKKSQPHTFIIVILLNCPIGSIIRVFFTRLLNISSGFHINAGMLTLGMNNRVFSILLDLKSIYTTQRMIFT